MKKTDWSLLALNTWIAFVLFASALDTRHDEAQIVYMLTTLAVVISSLVIVWSARREPVPAQRTMDELDATAVLDLDARLDALERAQHDAVDAARWRALVESGQVSGPADLGPGSDRRASAVRNGV